MKTITYILILLGSLSVVASAQAGEYIRINGYGSVEYEKNLSDRGRGDKNGSFDADGFDLVFNIIPAERFRVAADLNWEHGTAVEDGYGNVGFEYVFAEYTVANALKLRAGKQFTHFGIYNEIHTAKPAFLFIKEPSSTLRVDRAGAAVDLFPRWGSGVTLLGTVDVLPVGVDYVLQYTNGDHSYDNPYEKDYDKTKAVNGRVRAELYESGSDFLRLGFSFYADDGDSLQLTTLGGQVEWRYDNLMVDGEYVMGDYKPVNKASVSRNGFYLLAGYTLFETVTPYVRFEYFEPNEDVTFDLHRIGIVGVNYRVNDYLFVKAEVDRFVSESKNTRHKGVNYTELKTSISFGF